MLHRGVVAVCVPALSRVTAGVYRKKWGSVAFGAATILSIKAHLCFWTEERYTHGAKLTVKVRLIFDSLKDSFWWGKMFTLSLLYQLVRWAFEWLEGCPCHTYIDKEGIPEWVVRVWSKCPNRAQRWPEICAGDFFEGFRELCSVTAFQLHQGIDPRLPTACLPCWMRRRGMLARP